MRMDDDDATNIDYVTQEHVMEIGHDEGSLLV
jgi:hypothetical protein